jgi:hypothetical protein
MSDNATISLDRLLSNRERPLNQRFPGTYRAIVVETNDPLNMHRIRFKCPEMHDWDLKPEECPWAVSQFALGGKNTGSWVSPCIGDWVWITLEKQHPYGPIWTGFCTPTRRAFYPYPAIYSITPLPVDQEGNKKKSVPNDYNSDYLPKDSRPMSSGLVDRYGSMDIVSSVGFFPAEHKAKPPGADNDPLQSQITINADGEATPYKQTSLPPEMNKPDGKFMVRLSKYGHLLLMGDQGYHWQTSDTTTTDNATGKSTTTQSEVGEFYGDVDKDSEWEIARWKYLQKLINEDSASGADQRRMMSLTRYGHKMEMRDVGWNKTRDGEYGEPRVISDSTNDERWIKHRTKGGMLFQMSDIGFDPVDDTFVKRKLIDEVGTKTEQEDQYWKGDARWMRAVTRYGIKLVLDDRGSSTTKADTEENPRGYGILLKGRRTPGAQGTEVSGNPKGFFWEFNEKDQINQSTWGSPLGTTVQINDKLQYFMVGARRSYPMPWQGIKANEFLEDPLVSEDTEFNSHHLKLDLHNEYIRLKTAGGHGPAPWGNIVNPRAKVGIQQGLECRDGSLGEDPWTELVDIDDRGLWFSGKDGLTVCRAKQQPNAVKICWWFDETKKEIVIKNSESGKIQIVCGGDVEVIAQQDAKVYAKRNISMRSNNKITLMGGSGLLEIDSSFIKINKVLRWKGYQSYIPIQPPDIPVVATTPQLRPTNRGTRYNTDLEHNKDII